MLEIWLLIKIHARIADLAEDRNRSGHWGWLGIAMWIAAEIGGFVVATAFGFAGLDAWVVAVGFAGLGAALAFAIVKALPPVSRTAGGFPRAWIHPTG